MAHTCDMTTQTMRFPNAANAANAALDPRPLFVAAVDIATPVIVPWANEKK